MPTLNAPLRPVVLRFVFGKGLVKARRDSANTARAIVEQVTANYAEATFDEAKRTLLRQVERDVRAELIHMQALFRKLILGISGRKLGPTGILDTVSKGGEAPRANLSSLLPTWAPRDAAYLDVKKSFTKNHNWFDNSGWNDAPRYEGGTLREAFKPASTGGASASGSGGAFPGSDTDTMFEHMFGGIKVEVLRNKVGRGTNAGNILVSKGKHMQTQLATIRVRALGSLTDSMINASSSYNDGLMQKVREYDPDIADRLGGRSRYRPTLEPFLKFYLQQSIPQAVRQRIAKGAVGKSLFRTR